MYIHSVMHTSVGGERHNLVWWGGDTPPVIDCLRESFSVYGEWVPSQPTRKKPVYCRIVTHIQTQLEFEELFMIHVDRIENYVETCTYIHANV